MSDIVIAPFSNSAMRDWPLPHFSALAGLLWPMLGGEDGGVVRVVGTAAQRLRGAELVRPHPATRVVNECGRHGWPALVALVAGARLVVSNNSGIGHLGAHLRRPTLCVFGGSHQRHEWRPLGPTVVLVSRAIGCSPCQLDHGWTSPYGQACLRQIAPEVVAAAARRAMAMGEG